MRKDSLQNKTSWELQAAAETHRFLHPLLAACAVITCDPTMRLAVAVLVFVGSVVAAARAANLRTDRDVAPQLTPATYDVAMSTRLMHMCAAAYCPTGIGNWTCNACVEAGFNVTTIATESTWELLAYVGYDPTADAVVVAFRGSSNLPNWILDLWAVSGTCHDTRCSIYRLLRRALVCCAGPRGGLHSRRPSFCALGAAFECRSLPSMGLRPD